MSDSAQLQVNLQKLQHNSQTLNHWCQQSGIALAAVVKAGCGNPTIANAIAGGGAAMLADSRLHNIQQLRLAGVEAPIMLLRLPSPAQAESVVRYCDYSLNSEPAAIEALSAAAMRQNRIHQVLLMVELGDRREGIPPQSLHSLVSLCETLPGVHLAGIGTNLGCLGGIRTTEQKLNELVQYAEQVESRIGRQLDFISGGNTGALPLLLEGRMPARINHLRMGFGILQGRDPFTDLPIPGLHTDIFNLEADLIELQRKHSIPDGEIVIDAFGHIPTFEDRGEQLRGIVNLGRLDTDLTTLRPADPAIEILGASSDHLVLNLSHCDQPEPAIGSPLSFNVGYGALVQAMLSPSVAKVMV